MQGSRAVGAEGGSKVKALLTAAERADRAAAAALPNGCDAVIAIQLRPAMMWLPMMAAGVGGFLLMTEWWMLGIAVAVAGLGAMRVREYSSVLAATADGSSWLCRTSLAGRRSAAQVTVSDLDPGLPGNYLERSVTIDGRRHGVFMKFDQQVRELERLCSDSPGIEEESP